MRVVFTIEVDVPSADLPEQIISSVRDVLNDLEETAKLSVQGRTYPMRFVIASAKLCRPDITI